MHATILSSKGQVVIPKHLRQAYQWEPGMALTVEETPQGLLLRRAEAPFPPTRLEDVMGCLRYAGPALSEQQIQEAIAADLRAAMKGPTDQSCLP